MDRRYSFDSDPGELAPLDNHNDHYSSPARHGQSVPHQTSPRHHYTGGQLDQQPHYYQDDLPPAYAASPGRTANRPGGHPDSDFARLREERRRSRGYGGDFGAGASSSDPYAAGYSSRSVPQPPPHRANTARSNWSAGGPTDITPGADNFGAAAAGGLTGIASTVAEQNARQSGLNAMAATDPYGHQGHYDQGYDQPAGDQQGPYASRYRDASPAAAPSGDATPARSQRSDPFEDPRYPYGQRLEPGMALGQVNPNDIIDDGDDGLEYGRSGRNSMLSLGKSNPSGPNGSGAALAGAAAGGAAAGGLLAAKDHNVLGASSDPDLAGAAGAKEQQSQWRKKETGSRNKRKWLVIGIIALIVLGGIAGGIAGGLVSKKNSNGSNASSSSGGGQSASQDSQENGDLDINSSEIKALLNNPNLHKVFPGVDYTPVNTQYPGCLTNPPSQNNVTRDVAVLSQLTNIIRLYGTDCNQTEMTIHALKQLKMDSDMKIWLGVWQDNNATTNARQLAQMWDILDTYGATPFKGLIVANEILFREQMTETELGNLLSSVRTNLTSKGMSLPVATSDLGDKWTSSLAAKSDYIMSNIHPFFGGINAKDAASWTYTFWDGHNKNFFKSDAKQNVISEIGWPSQGGMDCGSDTVTDCPDQAVAGITEMNQLLDDWVCDALNNGTNYFWFEMFDEPWKIQFDTGSQNWEDHWGIMDIDRKLKDGVKIPDCGGKTVGDSY